MTDLGLSQPLAIMLAPALPYLMSKATAAGQKAIDTLTGKLGETAANKVEQVWNKLWPSIEKKPDVVKAMQEVAENPEDTDAKAVLSWQLKKVLADLPPETLDEIKNLIATKGSDIRNITATHGGVSVGGNIQGSTVTTSYHGTEI
jgi:thioredoxin-like negative regulator of GroEL